jgi:N,N'-diacetylchitobiose transport system permease protein
MEDMVVTTEAAAAAPASGSPSPSPAPEAVGRPRRRFVAAPYLLALPTLAALFAVLGYPLYRAVVLSLQNFGHRQLISGEPGTWAGFSNYVAIFKDSFFWQVVEHTVLFTASAVLISVALGLGVALLMRRVSRSVRQAMIVAMMLVWAMPALVATQIFLWMVDADFGVVNWLIDKIPGVNFTNHSWFADPLQGWMVITAVVVWGAIPFLAITLYAGLTQVPRDVVEAATVDGASPWQVFRAVTLPIIRPLLSIVLTLSVIWDFQVFTQIWALRGGRPEQSYQTLGIYSFVTAFGESRYSLGSAISIITVLLMLGVLVFYVRQMFRIGEQD